MQVSNWVGTGLEEGRETVITALPLYHIFALTGNCLTFMKIGAKNVLIPNPRDMPGFVAELGRHRFTAITGVNTLFNALMNTPGFAKLDFSRAEDDPGRRHGRAARGGRALDGGDADAARRGLRAHRDFARAPASTRW